MLGVRSGHGVPGEIRPRGWIVDAVTLSVSCRCAAVREQSLIGGTISHLEIIASHMGRTDK